MSVVDDVPKLLQDLVAPELRALAVRMDNLDRRIDSVEKQIAELRGELRAQTDSLRAEMRTGVEYIVSQLRVDQRLGRLEEESQRKKQLPDKQ
jgi:predicted RNase H-like nuclease (RuvC/YqgF family)